MEGWVHFPLAQARLLAVMKKHQPKGLVFLSGDVHFAELLTTKHPRGQGHPPIEVTTSGMTHTCTQTALGLCKYAIRMYHEHRETPEAFYLGYNYGSMEFDWSPVEENLDMKFVVRVHDAQGRQVLHVNREVPKAPPGLDYNIYDPYTALYGTNDPGLDVGLAALGVMVAFLVLVVRWWKGGAKDKIA